MKSYIDQNKLRNIFLDENGTGVYNHKTIENSMTISLMLLKGY